MKAGPGLRLTGFFSDFGRLDLQLILVYNKIREMFGFD